MARSAWGCWCDDAPRYAQYARLFHRAQHARVAHTLRIVVAACGARCVCAGPPCGCDSLHVASRQRFLRHSVCDASTDSAP
eukprot:3263756-Rhodomonas_salina.2